MQIVSCFRKKKDKVAKDGKQLDGHERGKGRGKETEKDGDTDHEEPVKQLSEAELMLIQRLVVLISSLESVPMTSVVESIDAVHTVPVSPRAKLDTTNLLAETFSSSF